MSRVYDNTSSAITYFRTPPVSHVGQEREGMMPLMPGGGPVAFVSARGVVKRSGCTAELCGLIPAGDLQKMSRAISAVREQKGF